MDRHRLIVDTDLRSGIEVPFGFAVGGATTHGYATTIHKAQGATVDRCFVLADETISREHAYTAMSRGRHGNELYVDSPSGRDGESRAVEIEADELDSLRRNLGRSISQELSIDRL
jgi:ATP-dependent exoDNAse (exonuclease V) alpha subunit